MVALGSVLLAVVTAGGGDTVLLDFYSDSCGPCRMMAPVVEQLAAKGYPVRQINVAAEPGVAARFGISAIPCFVMLVDGREVDRSLGLQSIDRLQQMLARGAPQRTPTHPERPIQFVSSEGRQPLAITIPSVASNQGLSDTGSTVPAKSPEDARRENAAVPGWRLTSPDWAAASDPKGAGSNELVAATVRVRVEDPNGHSIGSGTIIDARQGEALVLTCGHLFRDSKGQGRIEVDLFAPTSAAKLPATLIHWDTKLDLGLLSIRTPGPVTVARVAPPGYAIVKGARAYSCGCNNGDPPTVRQSVITDLNR
jgi:thiol-disulfide isomerase/thioredoxin